jgi:hypothetical protein
MTNELLIAKGKLADLKKQYEDLERKADSLLIVIRELLSPATEFLDFRIDTILDMVKDFREMQMRARKIKDEIEKIKNVYNLE